MKRKKIKLFLYILLIIAGLYFALQMYHYLRHKTNFLTKNSEVQLWTCPMHPQIIMEKPGECPICHMSLVPFKEKLKEEQNVNNFYNQENLEANLNSQIQISIEPAFIQKMNLRTEKAQKKEVQKKLSFLGHIDYNETKIYVINTRVSGWIEKLYAKYEGKYVQKGEVLLSIYSPELVSTQEEYLNIFKQYHFARKSLKEEDPIIKELYQTLHSSKERLKQWNISEYQIQEIEKNQTSSKLLPIRSPYSGFIIEKKIYEGQRVEQGMDLFKIANFDPAWIIVHVPEQEIPFIYIGQSAKIKIAQIPNQEYKGKLSYMYPILDSTTRNLKTRIEIPNPKFEIKPGMYANIELFYKFNKKMLIIPYSAVIQTGNRNLAFVLKHNKSIEPREVEIGFTDGETWIEIRQGIEENEDVVVSAQFLLDSETRILEAVEKLKSHQH